MKRLAAAVLTLALILTGTFSYTAFAYSLNWPDAFTKYLDDELSKIQEQKSNYTSFALYDIENDGIPELFLKGGNDGKAYKIVRLKNGAAVTERSFVGGSAFYRNLDTEGFVISYTNTSGMYYVVYDQEKGLNQSDEIFKTRRYKTEDMDDWDSLYFFYNKEVTKEQYDKLQTEILDMVSISFSAINKENINEVYAGVFPAGKSPDFKGALSGSSNLSFNSVTFPNGESQNIESQGTRYVYGLLMINGDLISGFYPVNLEGTTLVPVRVVSENLNAEVSWNPAMKKVTIEGSAKIEMYIGDSEATVDGQSVTLDVPAQIINDSTYVPIRFVAENLNTDVYFKEGNDPFIPIINVESKGSKSTIDESQALAKASSFFDNIEWVPNQMVFTRSYMEKNLAFKSEGLVLGRYWSIVLDVKDSQRLWIDQYTGQVYSVYTANDKYGIELGTDAVISTLASQYLY
ncbi:copper amine oxidase N-terminal domain-containing protein [Anaeropeptidivorans aminofermentans]|jgi:hypothetical protein|uniref:copper amine oxidase N-terminal domain-containing protein n=1 Tax=Anaeropeptidivorans aminofermentans TaxID=2934315 RepID=UPI002025AF95|nr:copper amine oxidase N-terminal domain-containing protein [Anaeropeptidivorans aminofermentans]MBE6013161.1 copper amine oxidase N-terminal domain-containing protein [Lachnospiraceae bacterium]